MIKNLENKFHRRGHIEIPEPSPDAPRAPRIKFEDAETSQRRGEIKVSRSIARRIARLQRKKSWRYRLGKIFDGLGLQRRRRELKEESQMNSPSKFMDNLFWRAAVLVCSSLGIGWALALVYIAVRQ